MKNLKEKKGISLIVLVITIIIMIILAAAIILSLSNSGIIGKASKAKQDSDTANLKEYANILEAEWELMSESERNATNCSTSTEYVNTKFEEKGYTGKTYSADGIIYTDLPDTAKATINKGIKIGDVVNYEVTAKTEPSSSEDNGYIEQTVSNKTDFVWRYIGVNDNGEILIAPDVTSDAPKLKLNYIDGYVEGPDELNRLCDVLYSTDKGTARSMTIEDVNKLLGYTGPKGSYVSSLESKRIYTDTPLTIQQIIDTKGEPALTYTSTPEMGKDIVTYKSDYYEITKKDDVSKMKYPDNREYVFYGSGSTSYDYWLASPCVDSYFSSGSIWYGVRRVTFSAVSWVPLFGSDLFQGDLDVALRPVVSLNSDVTITKSESVANTWNI